MRVCAAMILIGMFVWHQLDPCVHGAWIAPISNDDASLIGFSVFPTLLVLLFPRKMASLAIVTSVVCVLCGLLFFNSSYTVYGKTASLLFTLLYFLLLNSARRFPRRKFEVLVMIPVYLITGFIVSAPFVKLYRLRVPSNEAAAVGSIKQIQECALAYRVSHPNEGFPLIKSQMVSMGCLPLGYQYPQHSGYFLSYVPKLYVKSNRVIGFMVFAIPTDTSLCSPTGIRRFYGDENGLITYTAEPRPASATDKPL